MNKFLLVFSPVFCGLLAGLLYLMNIQLEQIAAPLILAGLLTLGFGVLVAPRAISSIRSESQGQPAGYKHPQIVGAKVTEATLRAHEGPIRIGELEISASHSRHVSSRLPFLPTGSIIQTIERGSLYRLRFPIQSLTIGANTDRSDRLFVEEVARANGYRGRIQ